MSNSSSPDRGASHRHILEDAPELLASICREYDASLNQVVVAFMIAAQLQGGDRAARFMHTATSYMVGELVCRPGE